MSKRFIDTELWDKADFNSCSSKIKLLTIFITCKCDSVGVFKMAPMLVTAYIGEEVSEDDILSIPCDIEKISNNCYWLTKFCHFQYGELKEECRPHRKYIQLLKSYKLHKRVSIPFQKGFNTLEEKDKEKEKDKDNKKEGFQREKKSLDDRKQDFRAQLNEAWKNLGGNEYLTLDHAKDFFEYWTEHGPNDQKMRFEKEKSFGIGRRLGTWKKNNQPKASINPNVRPNA